MEEILCGIDWASDHHEVALIDPEGAKLARRRISDDATGLGELAALFAAHGGGPGTVKIAIETERGLLVASLRAAGYAIYPVNPKTVDRYRDRHHLARGKSGAADAMVLAHILRTDAHLHRPLPAGSPAARAIEVLARAHQDLVWSRQREVNRLRSLLAGYYPAALAAFADLTTRTAMTVLAAAPAPPKAPSSAPRACWACRPPPGAGDGGPKRHGWQRCSPPRRCPSHPKWKPRWAPPPPQSSPPSPR
jgi:transposase